MNLQAETKQAQKTVYRRVNGIHQSGVGISGNTFGEKTFFYIGDDEQHFNRLSEELGHGWKLSNLPEAESAIRHLPADFVRFDVICLDLGCPDKFAQGQILKLLATNFFINALVVINLRGLEKDEINDIRAINFIDEAIDFRSETALLPEKLAMARRIKPGFRSGKSVRVEQGCGEVYRRLPMAKRIFDGLLASLLFIMLMPLMLLIGLAIKLESRGPVLYKTYRAGGGYKVFKYLTFRTLRVGSDRMLRSIAHMNNFNNFGHLPLALSNPEDPRLTRLGRLLMKSRMDRLPLLWNVVCGDMSFVGNRPMPLLEASALTSDQWMERFSAPAGLFGLWQLADSNRNGHRGLERIMADVTYARQTGIWTDLQVMSRGLLHLLSIFLGLEHGKLPGTASPESFSVGPSSLPKST